MAAAILLASVQAADALPPRGACEAAFDHREETRYGQLVIIGFNGTKPGDAGAQRARGFLAEGLAGGLVFFDKNIESPGQLGRLTGWLAAAPPRWPAFLAVDEEGGRVQRLARRKGFRFERAARWVASQLRPLQAKRLYRRMAADLARAGLNLNFGPVADLSLNPANPVIAQPGRSYGQDPLAVAEFAGKFVEAHRSYGIATAIKHFPGHGSSQRDTHFGLADVTRRWQARELIPFVRLIEADRADMVMISHLVHREYWSDGDQPASLAPPAIRELLRGTLGYDGVVITDDLQMRAITRGRGLGRAIVEALDASNDIVLIGNALAEQADAARFAVDAIKAAAHSGELDQRELACSFLRVIRLKTHRYMSLRF